MKIIIENAYITDVRFPTSKTLDGSDAMNPEPDYSAAYLILTTNVRLLEGHGFAFTIGRGNEICVAAIKSVASAVIGQSMQQITSDMAGFWRMLAGDSQHRWLGPEKGVIHLAVGAVVNAVWDLWAKMAQKPLWQLLADMPVERLVSCIDFSYITDAITPSEAWRILTANEAGKAGRIKYLLKNGYDGYTTSPGWLGYSDDKVRRLCRAAVQQGWRSVKMKVGLDLAADIHRATIIREEIGSSIRLMMDANQKWSVAEAISHMRSLAAFNPHWIEEPTSPDDILGHATIAQAIAPIKVATGEHCHNRIMFKQLMQLNAIGYCQIDSCRVAGVNENLAIMLMAAKYNIPVCPHAGGVGLCELVQHLSFVDFICISGTMEDRMIEHVDHLHEHFIHPVAIKNGRYMPPLLPGFSSQMKKESLQTYEYPSGLYWSNEQLVVQRNQTTNGP